VPLRRRAGRARPSRGRGHPRRSFACRRRDDARGRWSACRRRNRARRRLRPSGRSGCRRSPWSAAPRPRREQRCQDRPFGIAQVGRAGRLAHPRPDGRSADQPSTLQASGATPGSSPVRCSRRISAGSLSCPCCTLHPRLRRALSSASSTSKARTVRHPPSSKRRTDDCVPAGRPQTTRPRRGTRASTTAAARAALLRADYQSFLLGLPDPFVGVDLDRVDSGRAQDDRSVLACPNEEATTSQDQTGAGSRCGSTPAPCCRARCVHGCVPDSAQPGRARGRIRHQAGRWGIRPAAPRRAGGLSRRRAPSLTRV
jgi:hypothetical protein